MIDWQSRGWTRVEVAIWKFTLAIMVIAGALAVTGVIDSWALLVGNLIAVATALMRYRAERANREADEHDEEAAFARATLLEVPGKTGKHL